jgi:hypothetical protein
LNDCAASISGERRRKSDESAHTRCKIRDQQNWKSGKDKIEISSGRPQHAESKKNNCESDDIPIGPHVLVVSVAK